ncbi:MAG: hypothetical protein RI956_605 [Pseudomonadota bacterium]
MILNFNFLDGHLVSIIINLEEKISTYLIRHINTYPNNQAYKDLIFTECIKIIKNIENIDSNINNLI